MLIPSIDIIEGQAVQLIGGQLKALEAGSPAPIAERFSRVGPIAVIDLDAALSRGNNESLIKELCGKYNCRVGGGIRDIETANRWLDAGAEKIIIGTKASPEFLAQLPKDRVIAALDAKDGEVVVEGWTAGTGQDVLSQINRLKDFVSGFLITFVECEGRMMGTRMDLVPDLVQAAGCARITIAGGVSTAAEIAQLDALGADAQVGMALYTGQLDLAEAFTAPLKSDRSDGLWPTVVVDQYERALGFCYSNLSSLSAALEEGQGIYWSRRRGLWRKGASSGASQSLINIAVDCDRDALRFKVIQKEPGFCHLGTKSCWGPLDGIYERFNLIESRKAEAPEGSYTQRLFGSQSLLNDKILEEAQELTEANDRESAVWETADLIYFALVKLAGEGADFSEVERMLRRRSLAVSRRPGDAKAKGVNQNDC